MLGFWIFIDHDTSSICPLREYVQGWLKQMGSSQIDRGTYAESNNTKLTLYETRLQDKHEV